MLDGLIFIPPDFPFLRFLVSFRLHLCQCIVLMVYICQGELISLDHSQHSYDILCVHFCSFVSQQLVLQFPYLLRYFRLLAYCMLYFAYSVKILLEAVPNFDKERPQAIPLVGPLPIPHIHDCRKMQVYLINFNKGEDNEGCLKFCNILKWSATV